MTTKLATKEEKNIIPFKEEKEKTKNIYQRMNAVMAEVDYIQKSDKKVNNQYRFVSHDMVASVFHCQLVKHGIATLPTIRETKQDGNRTEVLLDVKFVNIDDPNDHFIITSLGYGIDAADKGPGKAVSYAFKYALLKAFCMETGDDPDEDQNTIHKVDFRKDPKWMPSSEEIREFVDSFGDDCELFERYINYLSQLSKTDVPKIMKKAIQNKEKAVQNFKDWKENPKLV